MATRTLYQVKVALLGVSPPLWRRLLVSSKMKLGTFHAVLQGAFGWQGHHLHEFEADDEIWGSRATEPNEAFGDENKIMIGRVLREVGESLLYTYDFGDDWRHKVTLERVIPDGWVVFPDASCLTGRRGCPPDDCGGPGGYAEFLRVLRDKNHEEYAERWEWVGQEFDSERFDLVAINETLKTIKA